MIILASASPRRKELLKNITSDFKIIPSTIEEVVPEGIPAIDTATYLSTQKALDVSKNNPNDIIIAADTIIVFNNEIYGKPKDKEEAKKMLSSFSGNTHLVVTGVCVSCKERTISFSSVNEVEFYKLTEQEIDEYLSHDEYKDKAGSYAIQGKANLFVKSIKGDYNSIVGLPVSQLNRVLKDFFNI